jgi:cyclopropane fatty-acyl-phospholipid synthase-like methyltransferase
VNEIPAILTRYRAGNLSAPVTLMQLLIETEDFAATRAAVEGIDELDTLLAANAAGCERIASMLRADVDSAKPAASIDEGIAFCERLFDWSVQQSEEASVALYSLGNPELLERATAEIVAQLRSWGAVTKDTALLDVGCGIGRLLTALAPQIRSAVGIDVSAEMVKAARRRCQPYDNITVIKGDGRGLDGLDDASFDVAVAVDSFPYLRQSGYELVETFFAEVGRVLEPGGRFVILNYSYSDDDAADAQEVRALGSAYGFDLQLAAERPFQLWDGLAFLLRKSA